MLTNEENRELAGYFGICWHRATDHNNPDVIWCSCGAVIFKNGWDCHIAQNPDFSDSRVVLREMEKLPSYDKFIRSLNKYHVGDVIETRLMKDTTGLLARAALDFMRKEKG